MKLDYKLIRFIIFAVIAVAGCVYFFFALKGEKEVSQTDLFAYVPSDEKFLLQINSFTAFSDTLGKFVSEEDSFEGDSFEWMRFLNQLFSPLVKNTSLFSQPGKTPVLVSFHDKGEVFYVKTTLQDEKSWEKLLGEDLFPSFTPVIKNYKGFTIRYYTLSENHFLCCIIKDGIFIGTLNYELLQHTIDEIIQGNSIMKNVDFQEIIATSGKKALATLFYCIDAPEDVFVADTTQRDFLQFSGWSNSDITFMGDEIWLSGYFRNRLENVILKLPKGEKSQLLFPSRLIPDKAFFIKGVSLKKNLDSLEPDTLGNLQKFPALAVDELYTLYINEAPTNSVVKLYALKQTEPESFSTELYPYLLENYLNTFGSKMVNFNGKELKYTMLLSPAGILNELAGFNCFSDTMDYFFSSYENILFVAEDDRVLDTYFSRLAHAGVSHKLLEKNLNTPCHLLLQGEIGKLRSVTSSPLQLSPVLSKAPDFFSTWHFGLQLTIENELLFYHCVFSKIK
ncbi:MAG: hypothetical protein LBD45_00150 [Bacteroidales bacterium]|jgi:hypothetical protein|nr:hypothetical protein [Bacteroidales bacterium]